MAVVDDLGEEVVQGLLVGAADIHAGAAAHRFQTLQHLDVGGGIALLRALGLLARALAAAGAISASSLSNRSRTFGFGMDPPSRIRRNLRCTLPSPI